MSIPSIRFIPANRRPQAILNSKSNSKLKFDLSSSYSYSYSDDIPTLETLNKQSNQPALLSSASLESDDYDYPAKDDDWTAKRNPTINNKPTFQNNNIRNDPVQKKPNKEIQSKDSDNELIFEYNEAENIEDDNNNNNNVSQIPNENNEAEPIQDKQENQPNQLQPREPENNINSNSTQEMITTSINNAIEGNQDSSGKLSSFLVFKQTSSFSKNKTKYRMEENSRAIFFASESKDFKGKAFTITSNSNLSSETVGYIHINSNHEIFTIATNEELFNDDREGELCGIELAGEIVQQTPTSKNKYKKIKIVFPKNGKPYYPISRRKSLSKIVQIRTKREKNMVTFKNNQGNNNEDFTPNIEDSSLKLERFDFLESTTPSDDSQDRKSEELNKFLINPSPKNFIFRNKEGKTIFIFFKIASGSYNASFCPPITPIIAFGICIAVISSSK